MGTGRRTSAGRCEDPQSLGKIERRNPVVNVMITGTAKMAEPLPNLVLPPTKSGYLEIVGIEDFWLKENNARSELRPIAEATHESRLLGSAPVFG